MADIRFDQISLDLVDPRMDTVIGVSDVSEGDARKVKKISLQNLLKILITQGSFKMKILNAEPAAPATGSDHNLIYMYQPPGEDTQLKVVMQKSDGTYDSAQRVRIA